MEALKKHCILISVLMVKIRCILYNCLFQLHLLSTWGDPYYVGLNGLEFYDAQGNRIPLDDNNVSAYPESVNVLEGVENDVR